MLMENQSFAILHPQQYDMATMGIEDREAVDKEERGWTKDTTGWLFKVVKEKNQSKHERIGEILKM